MTEPSTAWKVAREAAAKEILADLPVTQDFTGDVVRGALEDASALIRSLPEPPEFRAAVEAEMGEVVEMLREVVAACDAGRMRALPGVGGMTIEACIRGSVYDRVPAWPIEEARATLPRIDAALAAEKEAKG